MAHEKRGRLPGMGAEYTAEFLPHGLSQLRPEAHTWGGVGGLFRDVLGHKARSRSALRARTQGRPQH